MSNRIYDSSQLTKRKAEKAIAGSFLSRMYPTNPVITPQSGAPPILGDYNSSVMYAVKTGGMTEYTRYPVCIGISPGCPCPDLNASIVSNPAAPAIPGAVSGITFTVGSIIVSWQAPLSGEGPFTYLVTPYLNGVAQTPVTTSETSYRFTELSEWQPYTFNVCAMNSLGTGPIIPSSSYFLAPPSGLSAIMNGGTTNDIEPSLKYVINSGLNIMLEYAALANIGPTKGARVMYIWITSVVSAWNWVRSESRITGTHDNWNWDLKAVNHLSDSDCITWLCIIIDYITPRFVGSKYKSIYNCPASVIERVKSEGDWDNWVSLWQDWYNYRQSDGFANASTQQPTGSANWNETINVDSSANNISGFPQPREWTRLTVKGKKQNYLTYDWLSVLSSCLTPEQDQIILDSVQPLTGNARDNEIDDVKNIAVNLTDEQKVIAEFWAGSTTNYFSPPLTLIWLWKEYIKSINTVSCPNIMFSLQDLAIHLFEGSRVTWGLKKKFMESRPIQEIRRRYAGQMIQSWNGVVDGALWMPYQIAALVTPPFADFPSGHSHFSKAFALTMNKWFGQNITKNMTFYDNETITSPMFSSCSHGLYGDFMIMEGTSQVEPGICPAMHVTLSFNKWDDMADSAGLSRLYGGIHALTAHTASQAAAVEVDGYINATWNIQTGA